MTSPSRCPLLRLQNFKLVNQNMWSKKSWSVKIRNSKTPPNYDHRPSGARYSRPASGRRSAVLLLGSFECSEVLALQPPPPRDQEKKRRSSVLRRRSPPQDVSRPPCTGVRYRCVIDLCLCLYLYLYLSLQVVTYSQYEVP